MQVETFEARKSEGLSTDGGRIHQELGEIEATGGE
jgi:hypothetical protein